MRVHVLCSFYDEHPDHLREMVGSCAAIADSVVAVDGAYGLYPCARNRSSSAEYAALGDACDEHALALTIHRPAAPWTGNEVEKRAKMFHIANGVATPWDDWFIIMDGDMMLCQRGDHEGARMKLAEAPREYMAGAITFGELPWGATLDGYDNLTSMTAPFRSLFRAIPGLTVEWAHYFYNVVHADGSRDYLWYDLPGRHGHYKPQSDVWCVDLMNEITLLHRPWARERDRVMDKGKYHAEAQARVIERVPPFPPGTK